MASRRRNKNPSGKTNYEKSDPESEIVGNDSSFLSGSDIINLNIIDGAIPRDVSIDLRVGTIIKNGEPEHFPILIKPQEMLLIVFADEVRMPHNCFGIAFPKTEQSRKGLHILNTGIVDPGYEGLLSTVVLNYSAKAIEIRENDIFMRIAIFRNANAYTSKNFEIENENYYQMVINNAKKYPDTFMDIQKQVKEISEEVSSRMLNKLMMYIAVLTFFVSLIVSIAGLIVPQILSILWGE